MLILEKWGEITFFNTLCLNALSSKMFCLWANYLWNTECFPAMSGSLKSKSLPMIVFFFLYRLAVYIGSIM